MIWSAAIAGGVGLLGNAATVWATQLQRASHDRTESRRIAADAERLKAEHAEAERQRRLSAYQALIVTLGEIDRMSAWTSTPTDEQVEALIALCEREIAGVLLIATDEVCMAMNPLTDVLATVGDEMARARQMGVAAAHTNAYRRHRAAAMDAHGTLLMAMRADVRG